MFKRDAPFVLLFGLLLVAACGGSGGDAEPAEDIAASQDTASEVAPDTPCVPACDDKVCGEDGCGGVCGTCPGDESCTEEGLCVPECGNGLCKAFENCKNCPADCGECCGNGTCDSGWGEDCGTCVADCGCVAAGACVEGACLDCLDTVAVEGGFSWACEEHADCIYGLCVPDDQGSYCSCACIEEEDCPEGWTCDLVDSMGADILFACVPECDLPVLTGAVWVMDSLVVLDPAGFLGMLMPVEVDPLEAGMWILIRVDSHDQSNGMFLLQVGYGTPIFGEGGTVTEVRFGAEPDLVAAHLDGCELVLQGPFDLPLAAPQLTKPLPVVVTAAVGALADGGASLAGLHVTGAMPLAGIEDLCAELTGFETPNLHELLYTQGSCPDTDLDGDEVLDALSVEVSLGGPQTQLWAAGTAPFPFLDAECAPHTEVCVP